MDPDVGEYQGNKGTGTGGRGRKDPNRGQNRKGAVKRTREISRGSIPADPWEGHRCHRYGKPSAQ